MSVRLPRRTTHHGVVRAHGLWFGSGIVDAAELQRRVLACWEPGAQVSTLGGDYIIRFREPRHLAVAASAGAPLTLENNALTSAPLRASERALFEDGAWLILVEAGVPRAFEARQWQAVDPADWLDLRGFPLGLSAPLESLADPPLKFEPGPDPQSEIARRLARTPEHRREQTELLAALSSQRREPTPNAPIGQPNRLVSALMRALFIASRAASSLFQSKLFQRGGGRGRSLPSAPNVLQRLEAAVARWIARSRLMTLLARKQAKYLQTLFEALEAHDDMEVLRRAIPLNDALGESASPALSAPSLRTDFSISLSAPAKATAIGLGGTLFNDLRRAYESVLARLTRAGKHEEAAFFLAEILKEPARAVDYLERQGRLLLAAQLAEARQLAPGLVVRQWFLAGDRDRALAIAVREGAFADAIARLERSGKSELADGLRMLHADRLASAGRFLAAARLVHARPGGALLALRWLALLREAGDAAGLALELSLDPQRFDEVSAALEPLLQLRTPQAADQRSMLAYELKKLDVASGKPLARELARELLVDASEFGYDSLRELASEVADWLGGAFRADFPRAMGRRAAAGSEPQRHGFAARHAGSRPILDVCECASRFVVALGEGGVLVLNRAGKRVAHFDTPAEQLVASHDGTKLLALTRRGHAWRVSQIDLATRRSLLWGELRADAFAPTFDGQTWVIARLGDSIGEDSELLVLDVFDDMPSVLRRIPVSGQISAALGIQIDAGNCNVFAGTPAANSNVERVRFELPNWTLRERKLLQSGTIGEAHGFLPTFAAVANRRAAICTRWGVALDGTCERVTVTHEHGEITLPIGRERARGPLRFQISENAFAVSLLDDSGIMHVVIGGFASDSVMSVIELEATLSLSVRLCEGHVLIGDEAGRLLSFDLASARCFTDLRV